jgi:hypothetical protein
MRSARCCRLIRSQFALSCTADRLFARPAQSGEVRFDTQQDFTRGRLDGGTLLVDILPTGIAHCGNFHERRLAGLREILKVCLDTFHEWTSSRLGRGTRSCHVPAARLYDVDILAKSGGCREQDEHCKRQMIPSHISLRSIGGAGKLTVAGGVAAHVRKVGRTGEARGLRGWRHDGSEGTRGSGRPCSRRRGGGVKASRGPRRCVRASRGYTCSCATKLAAAWMRKRHSSVSGRLRPSLQASDNKIKPTNTMPIMSMHQSTASSPSTATLVAGRVFVSRDIDFAVLHAHALYGERRGRRYACGNRIRRPRRLMGGGFWGGTTGRRTNSA